MDPHVHGFPRRAGGSARAFLAAILAALAAAPSGVRAAELDFGTFRVFSTGEGPWVEPASIVAADFDGDGDVDLAAVNRAVSTVALLLGDGTGGFAASEEFDGGVFPRSAAAGDFDSDGLLDLAVAIEGNPFLGLDYILVLPGRAGAFDAYESFLVGAEPGVIAAADFDRDGHLDLAVAAASEPLVSLHLGDGAFGFTHAGDFALDAPASDLEARDVNGDGFLDLLAPMPMADAVAVLAGDGAGSFAALASVPVGEEPLSIAVADADFDGAADFATANFTGRGLSVRLGDGAGGFVAAGGAAAEVPIGRPALDVAAGDLDGDGAPDFAVSSVEDASARHGRAAIVAGDGAGGFALLRDFGLLGSPASIALARVDSDSALDLVAAGALGGKVAVRLGDGAGGFGGEPDVYPAVAGLAAIRVADLDADGAPDLLVAGEGALGAGAGIRVRRGIGGGLFGEPAIFDAGHFPRAIATGDFDGDGRLDACSGGSAEPGRGPGSVTLLLGDGLGGFALASRVDGVTRAYALVAADFDGDGALDAAVGKQGGANDLLLLMGDGAGGLAAGAGLDLGNHSAALVAADFDRDGVVDLASANNFVYGTIPGAEETSVSILAGDGSGEFALGSTYDLGIDPVSLVAADFDEDGLPDLAAGGAEATDVVLLANDGAGGFSSPPRRFFAGRLSLLAAADFDDDGHLDLAAAGDGGESVAILLGDGAGGFAEPVRIGVGGPSYAEGHFAPLAAADVDGEGHADLVLGVPEADVVSVLRNRGVFALPACVLGNVNAAAGARADVLFINGRKGSGPRRELEVDRRDVFTVRMKAPPSLDPSGPARFALFVAVGRPNETTVTPLPGGFGPAAFPLASFRKTFNNTGDEALFGAPDFPSEPAPSVPLRRERGIGKRVTVFLQGVIEDPASPSGEYGVTNGITVIAK